MHARAGLIGAVLLVTTGCATMAPQQLGQVVGTIAGAAAGTGVGAPLGGLLGLFAGMLFQKQVDQVTAKRERVELSDQLGSPPVKVTTDHDKAIGMLTRVWVDEAWQEGRLVDGHFEERYIP